MSKSWDSNILKRLKTLVGKGLSTSEIGKKLGMSKNAIVGKLHRLGWNTKAVEVVKPAAKKKSESTVDKNKKADTSRKVGSKKTVAAKETVKKAPAKKAVAQATKNNETGAPKAKGRAIAGKSMAVHQRVVQHALDMAALKPNQCRWPVGDPDSDGFHFCGQPVFVGKPYCYEHCKQAYQFVPPKKK